MARTSPKTIMLKLVLDREPALNYSTILQKTKRYERSSFKIHEDGKNLVIEITANDLTALRASANSVMRDLQVIGATKAK